MTVTGQSTYFVCKSQGAKNNMMQSVTCVLHTRADPYIVEKEFLSSHGLPKLIESTTKTLYSASKDRLKL